MSISLAFAVLAVGFPSLVMGIFTNQPALVGIGGSYLRVIGVTYLLSAVSQVYLATLKTHHLVKKSFAFSAATLLLNVLLNAVFIWGLFVYCPFLLVLFKRLAFFHAIQAAAVCGRLLLKPEDVPGQGL